MTYSYSSNIPQVQPVREVTFRDYAIDPSNKWHHRGNLPHCYSAEELMHRECLPASTMGEMLMKNSASVYHPSSNASSSFYNPVGRNGVLPQGFDQFFETAYGSSENQQSEYCGEKSPDKAPSAATSSSETSRVSVEKETSPGSSSPESSSGNNEEKGSNSKQEDEGKEVKQGPPSVLHHESIALRLDCDYKEEFLRPMFSFYEESGQGRMQ
eukprot:g48028.t1